MTNQVPVIKSTRTNIAINKYSNTLIARGLAAINNQNHELDAKYRQAKDVYDRITGCSWYDIIVFCCADNYWEDKNLKELHSCFTIFQSLADQGYGKAYFPLSIIYKDILGIPEYDLLDKQKGSYYAKLAYNWCFDNQLTDDPEIWSDLGMLYRWGEGVEIDNTLAIFWFKQAAEKDNAQAQFCLGLMYQYGKGVTKDAEKALYWYREAEKKSYMEAGYCQGFMARINYTERGNASEQYELSKMYAYGQNVEADGQEHLYWCRKSAEQDYPEAQFDLGSMYDRGENVEQDDRQAIYWYLKAANQGYLKAQIELGFLYRDGVSIEEDISGEIYDLHLEKDWEIAIYWFSKAAEQGHEYSQQQIQELLHKQEAVQKHRLLTEELKEFGIDRKAT